MLTIRVADYRGCRTAAIDCDPLALIAGKNYAGKTSIAQAVAAALTGQALNVEGVNKGTSTLLVRDGAQFASVEIGDIAADGSVAGAVNLRWPQCEAATKGKAPQASLYAAGLATITALKPDERARVLAAYLRADPTRADLAAAFGAAGIGEPEIVDAIWKLVEEGGWDGAYATRREKGAEFKGRWRQVTGRNFGERIAAAWAPEGWTSDLEDPAVAGTLDQACAAAQQAWQQAIADTAVSAAERARLKLESEDLRAYEQNRDKQQAALDEAIGKLDRGKAVRAALPLATQPPTHACPACGAELVIERDGLLDRLAKAQPVAAAELKRRRMLREAADAEIAQLEAQVAGARAAVGNATTDYERSAAAARQLVELVGRPVADTDPAAARERYDRANARLAQARAKRAADDARDLIASNEAALRVLAPDGLRADKLEQALLGFADTLAGLAEPIGWGRVEITPEMTVFYGAQRRPYALLSASEQYRVRALLQVAMARLDGSAMLVFDAAETLDAEARGEFFELLDGAGIPALVAMTLSRPSQVPDLAAAGIGRSFWLQGGELVPLQRGLAA